MFFVNIHLKTFRTKTKIVSRLFWNNKVLTCKWKESTLSNVTMRKVFFKRASQNVFKSKEMSVYFFILAETGSGKAIFVKKVFSTVIEKQRQQINENKKDLNDNEQFKIVVIKWKVTVEIIHGKPWSHKTFRKNVKTLEILDCCLPSFKNWIQFQ